MKLNRISLTAITLITMLAISGGCSKQNISANAVNNNTTTNNTEITKTIIEAPKKLEYTVDTPETAETSIPSNNTNLFPAYEYINGEKQYGFIDEEGTFIIQPGYSYVSDFNDGYAVITATEDYKVIDKSGGILYESDYIIKPYSNGAAVFSKLTGSDFREGYIDTKGKVMIELAYILADGFRKDNTAFVSTAKGRYEVIDKSGNILDEYQLDEKYNNVIDFKDGYIIYSDASSNKAGVITYKGEEILEPIYGNISYLGNDLFAVKEPALNAYEPLVTGPAAIYDKTGKQLTDYILYDLSEYHDGYASATNSQYTYFIDENGKEVTDLPKAEGRGKLTLLGNIVKAEIDDDLIYMAKDGTVIWQNKRTQTLSPELTVKELKFKPNKYAYVYYPSIEGLADDTVQASINGRLYKLFTDNRAGLKEEDGLSVADTFTAEIMKNILIIKKSGYDYTFGAAHGMPLKDYYFIDIKTGEFYDLSDLFIKKSDYVKNINKILGNMIEDKSEQGDALLFPDSFKGIKEDQYFRLTQDSLVIYFYPYDIAAYAAGFPEFEIPFEQLKDIIDYNGSFWNAFQDTGIN
ncbi:MAG: WG repeat-containing protein [Anaerocolumna sp.]